MHRSFIYQFELFSFNSIFAITYTYMPEFPNEQLQKLEKKRKWTKNVFFPVRFVYLQQFNPFMPLWLFQWLHNTIPVSFRLSSHFLYVQLNLRTFKQYWQSHVITLRWIFIRKVARKLDYVYVCLQFEKWNHFTARFVFGSHLKPTFSCAIYITGKIWFKLLSVFNID